MNWAQENGEQRRQLNPAKLGLETGKGLCCDRSCGSGREQGDAMGRLESWWQEEVLEEPRPCCVGLRGTHGLLGGLSAFVEVMRCRKGAG